VQEGAGYATASYNTDIWREIASEVSVLVQDVSRRMFMYYCNHKCGVINALSCNASVVYTQFTTSFKLRVEHHQEDIIHNM
jgi:hypothetical protein